MLDRVVKHGLAMLSAVPLCNQSQAGDAGVCAGICYMLQFPALDAHDAPSLLAISPRIS